MADVTGTIGQEEVNLDNAATEATLKKLLAVMEGKGKAAGGADAGKVSAKSLHELAQQSGKTTKELDELEESADAAGNALTRGIGVLFDAAKGLTSEFLTGGNRVSDFSSHITGAISQIPIIGGALGGTMQLFTSILDNQVDTFRDLSKVGIDFGESLFDAQFQATKTSLSMEQFQSVVTANSEMLSKLGGSASKGARTFTSMVSAMPTQQFLNLGLTMEEIAEGTADYMKVQARLGRSERLGSAASIAAATAYNMEIDKLAKATGKQRDEIAAEMDAVANDDRLRAIMMTLDDASQQAIQSTVTLIKSKDAELGEAVAEMISTGGIPYSEAGQALALLNPAIGDAAKALSEGVPGAADKMNEEIEKARQQILNMSDAELKQLAVRAAAGDEIAKTQLKLAGLGDIVESVSDAEKEQAAAQKKTNEGILSFEKRIQEAKNTIMNALVESGVFQLLETAVSDGAAMFTDFINGDGLGLLETAITKAKTTFTELVQAFKDGTLMETIGGYLGDGLRNLGTMMEPHITAALSGLKTMAMNAIFGKKKEQEGPPGGGGNSADLQGENGFTALGDIIKMIAGAGAIAGLTALGTMLAVGGGVYIGFKALTTILKMFANGPVAIGAAVFTGMLIGTGAAIKLAGEGISAAGDGVQKVADGVEQMANLENTANFTDLAGALGKLGPALLSLTAGNIIDGISQFFGAESPFTKLVNGINEFKNLDAAAVTNLGNMKTVGDNLALLAPAFASINAESGILDSIGSWFGKDSAFEKLVTGINEFKDIDATAVANIGTGADALNKLSGLDANLDSANLGKYADQLERVGEALEKMNEELNKDNSWLPFYKGENAGNTDKAMPGTGSGGGNGGDQLNTTMKELLEAVRYNTIVTKQGFRSISEEM